MQGTSRMREGVDWPITRHVYTYVYTIHMYARVMSYTRGALIICYDINYNERFSVRNCMSRDGCGLSARVL